MPESQLFFFFKNTGWNFISTEIGGCGKALGHKPQRFSCTNPKFWFINCWSSCEIVLWDCTILLWATPRNISVLRRQSSSNPISCSYLVRGHKNTTLFSQANCKAEGSSGVVPRWSWLTENNELQFSFCPKIYFRYFILFLFKVNYISSPY